MWELKVRTAVTVFGLHFESIAGVTEAHICQCECRCAPEAHYHHRTFFVSGRHDDFSLSSRCIAKFWFFFSEQILVMMQIYQVNYDAVPPKKQACVR
jgi:hypothetical protein